MLVLRFDEFTYLCFQDAKFNLAQIGLALAFCTTTFAAFLLSPLASAARQQSACASLHQLCPTHAAGRRGKEKGGPTAPPDQRPTLCSQTPEPLHQLSTRWHEQAAVSLRLSKLYGLHGVIFLHPPFFFWKRLLSSMMNQCFCSGKLRSELQDAPALRMTP